MSSEDGDSTQLITIAGLVSFDNLYTIIFDCVLVGIYIGAFTIGSYILWKKPHKSVANKILDALIAISFILFTLTTIQFISASLVLLKYGLIVTLPGGLPAQEMAADIQPLTLDWTIIGVWTGSINNLIADGIIAWRAWALWSERNLVRWSLILIMLVNITFNVVDSSFDTKKILSSRIISTIVLDWIALVDSLVVNLVATSLIAYRAWILYRTSSPLVHRKKTQAERVLILCVESGAILGVLQLADIVVQALDVNAASLTPIHQATNMVSGLSGFMVSLNPLALVLLVQTRNTYQWTIQESEGKGAEKPEEHPSGDTYVESGSGP